MTEAITTDTLYTLEVTVMEDVENGGFCAKVQVAPRTTPNPTDPDALAAQQRADEWFDWLWTQGEVKIDEHLYLIPAA